MSKIAFVTACTASCITLLLSAVYTKQATAASILDALDSTAVVPIASGGRLVCANAVVAAALRDAGNTERAVVGYNAGAGVVTLYGSNEKVIAILPPGSGCVIIGAANMR